MFCCKQKYIYCVTTLLYNGSQCSSFMLCTGRNALTYELCWFIWPFVDERFERLLHGVDKLVVLHKADVDDVIHLVFEVQQLLHHCFVLFWIDYDCAPESLIVNRINKIAPCVSSSDFRQQVRAPTVCCRPTLIYSIQYCSRTWTPLRTRLKSW